MRIQNYISLAALFFITLFTQKIEAQMFWNQACNFPSIDSEHVSVRHSTSLNITGSFTMEAWVNPTNVTSPPFQIIIQKRNTGADGYTLYISNGQIAIRTGSNTRLTGTAVIPNNSWSHIAGTYNSATNTFSTYVNGVFDASAVVAGAAPPANTDSLWIGKGGNSPFEGQMDEVRIWNRALSSTEVNQYRRTSLGSNTGPYNGLVLSLTFQDNDANGPDFSVLDRSSNNNTGIIRGATEVDLSSRPLQTIQTNDCIELDGASDYLTGPDNAIVSPTAQITLSAWIYPRSYANSIIIHKGPAAGGGGTNYRLSIVSNKLAGAINGNFTFVTDDTIPLHRWTNVAFTYYALLGSYQFFINGDLVYGGVSLPGNIVDGTDSLYIGGASGLVDFDGYIDEVRIIPDVKYTETINQFMFKSIDLSNGGVGSYAVYNFDGYAYNNGGSTVPLLRFNGNSSFAHCGAINNQPQSPQNRADNLNFENGFYLTKSNKRIPASGFSGSTMDSLEILLDEVISDINVFVTLNHYEEQDLEIYLFAPNGDAVQLNDHNTVVSNADHVTTIFDDQADSSLINLRYVSFSPRIRPFQNINTQFSGDSSVGLWRLLIRDVVNGGSVDTGILYGWGIQINNSPAKSYLLNVSNLIQGFYRPLLNSMIRDTMRYYIRNTELPYAIYDSAQAYVTNQGFAQLIFANVSSGVGYYLQLKHRNSIETWNYPLYYDPLTYQAEYSFLNPVTQAFGSNMIQVDNVPIRFAIYGGDVNQSGDVDGSDFSAVDNDAFNFVTGYVNTDVTGDNVTDASDFALVDNNVFNFVSKNVPPGAAMNPHSKENTFEKNIQINSSQDLNIDTEINKVPHVRIRTSEESNHRK